MANNFYAALLLLLTTAIQSAKGQSTTIRGYKRETGIQWPSDYDPAKSKFFIHNEIEINASAETVWAILITATEWPNWYEGAKNVKVEYSADSSLSDKSIITWKTMGLNMISTIREYRPFQYLSWESKAKGINGYHVWLIKPNAKGCIVITEESQNGWLTFFEKIFQPKKLYRLHNKWLSALKQKAEYQSSVNQQ